MIELRTLFVVVATITMFTASAVGKRVPPKPVTPVVSDSTQYSADGDGRDQYVVATDLSSGNVLWRAKVFHNQIKPWIEEDNQWVFLTDLKVVGSSLFVKDEKKRCYSVGLKTRHVTKKTCTEFTERQDTPVAN
jgi:hypothetical protein